MKVVNVLINISAYESGFQVKWILFAIACPKIISLAICLSKGPKWSFHTMFKCVMKLYIT